MDDDQGLRSDDGPGRPGRGGGGAWRNAFLNRPGRPEDEVGHEPRELGSRARSTSRSRAAGGNVEASAHAFDQQAFLDQDRALIEQLTQRQQRSERPAVRKPPPPPKVTAYRKFNDVANSAIGSQPNLPEPTGPLEPVSPERVLELATPQRQVDVLADLPACSDEPVPTETGILAAALASCREADVPANPAGDINTAAPTEGFDAGTLNITFASSSMATTVPLNRAIQGSSKGDLEDAFGNGSAFGMKPVVPRTGELFTASDIDAIMDTFGQSAQSQSDKPVQSNTFNLAMTLGRDVVGQNFHDVADDFYKSHGMDIPVMASDADQVTIAAHVKEEAKKQHDDFKVPERKALREQINAIDSWLEDDVSARERLNDRGGSSMLPGAPPAASLAPLAALQGHLMEGANDSAEAEVFQKLEEAKRLKAFGQKMSPVTLKNIAQQAAPLFPAMSLDKLVSALRLFTSARCEDHDLYLRILGEIPVQIRGVTPAMLITCVRVLWRLRLHEETYLELFSMEAMNMVRAKRRPAPRAPRRPPGARSTEAAGVGASALTPIPPTAPSQEAPAPFNGEQLVHLGNALSRLGAKHPARFMEVYQEQLALAIPRLTQAECELVCPTLAMSQLMHDPLRRAFLERCAQVEAGKPFSDELGDIAPDIPQFQQEADRRRSRAKNFRNVYIIEASVRKEFSFFSSLSADIRAHLDRLHSDAAQLKHEGATAFSLQVAAVLDQLGLRCNTDCMAGPLGLHVVAKATNPRAECDEIVYECSDVSSFYRLHQDDRNAVPQPTAWAKTRQRLLQRLGVQLTHISIWEWQQMSEAQRVNYMVKMQSFQ